MKRLSKLIILITLLFSISLPAFCDEESEYVVIFHGIARSSSHMEDLAEFLSKNKYEVINVDYPSTDYEISELTDIINKDLSVKLIKDKTVNFVGYSMGALMARAVITKYRPDDLGRVVQLAPPNKGSEVADFLEENWLFNKIYGPAGKQLTTGENPVRKLFGKIDYELGVVAGNSTIDIVSSSIIPGDDDGKVSVESTKVKGMKDHVVVSATHTFFPSNKDVHKQTLNFLMHGEFIH